MLIQPSVYFYHIVWNTHNYITCTRDIGSALPIIALEIGFVFLSFAPQSLACMCYNTCITDECWPGLGLSQIDANSVWRLDHTVWASPNNCYRLALLWLPWYQRSGNSWSNANMWLYHFVFFYLCRSATQNDDSRVISLSCYFAQLSEATLPSNEGHFFCLYVLSHVCARLTVGWEAAVWCLFEFSC